MPQINGSLIFPRWWRRVLPWGHIVATRQIRLNLCMLRPNGVHNLNGESISSPVFCTAHSRKSLYFTMGGHIPQNCPSHGGSGPHLINVSLGPPESWTQTASRSLQPFCRAQWRLISVTDRQTNRPRYSVGDNRPHLRTHYCDAM